MNPTITPSYNITYPPAHYELLEELENPIIQKFIPIPETHEKQLALARAFRFSTWLNKTGGTGNWLASNEFDLEDIERYYYDNYTKNFEERDMYVCFPIVMKDAPSLIICRTYNPEEFEETKNMNVGSWSSVYERNKGHLEGDLVVFAFIILFGTAGECVVTLVRVSF